MDLTPTHDRRQPARLLTFDLGPTPRVTVLTENIIDAEHLRALGELVLPLLLRAEGPPV